MSADTSQNSAEPIRQTFEKNLFFLCANTLCDVNSSSTQRMMGLSPRMWRSKITQSLSRMTLEKLSLPFQIPSTGDRMTGGLILTLLYELFHYSGGKKIDKRWRFDPSSTELTPSNILTLYSLFGGMQPRRSQYFGAIDGPTLSDILSRSDCMRGSELGVSGVEIWRQRLASSLPLVHSSVRRSPSCVPC